MRIRARLALTAVTLLGSFVLLIGISGAVGARRQDPQIARIMGKSAYRFSHWGLLEVDPPAARRSRR